MKKEMFSVADEDDCSRFILQAITQGQKMGRFPSGPGPVEVKLYINGVQYPFKTVVENLFERMRLQIDEEVEVKLCKVSRSGIADLQDILDKASTDIERAVGDAIKKLKDKGSNMILKKMWTDHPFAWLGDEAGKEAPVREIEVLSYDGNKYCRIKLVDECEDDSIRSVYIKAGYIYQDKNRFGEGTPISEEQLDQLRVYKRG